MAQPPDYALFVGVDIAAKTFGATWGSARSAPTPPAVLAQSPDGFAALHQELGGTGAPADATLIVMKEAGSSWVALAVYLHNAGYHVNTSSAHPPLHQIAATSLQNGCA
jgi:transposase